MGLSVAPTLAPFTMVELEFRDTVFPLVLFQFDLLTHSEVFTQIR